MYRNIVFDLGGVVFNYSPRDFLVEKFYHEPTERKIYDAVFGSEEWKLLDKGQISWREASDIFMQRGRDMDVSFEMQSVLEEWTDLLTTRKATVTLLRLLKKKGFNLYYLSNMSREVKQFLSSRDFWPLFDGGILSCEVGMTKPDLDIYRLLMQQYGLVPQETIFTDDVKENAETAYLVGITGIQFTDVKGFCKMLVTYGIDTSA